MDFTKDTTTVEPDYRSKIYDNLTEAYGADNLPSKEDFNKKLDTDKDYSQKLYDNLSEAYGKDNLPELTDFNNRLKKKAETSETTPTTSQDGSSGYAPSGLEIPSISQIKDQNKKSLQLNNSDIVKSKLAEDFKNNPNPAYQKAYLDKLSSLGYDRDKLDMYAGSLAPPSDNNVESEAPKSNPFDNNKYDLLSKYANDVKNTFMQGNQQLNEAVGELGDKLKEVGSIPDIHDANKLVAAKPLLDIDLAHPILKGALGVMNAVASPVIAGFNEATEGIQKTADATLPTESAKVVGDALPMVMSLAHRAAATLGYNPEKDSNGDYLLSMVDFILGGKALEVGGNAIKSLKDFKDVATKSANGELSPTEQREFENGVEELKSISLDNIEKGAKESNTPQGKVVASTIDNAKDPNVNNNIPTEQHEANHDKLAQVQEAINSPNFKDLPQDIQAPILAEHEKQATELKGNMETEAVSHIEDAKVDGEIAQAKEIVANPETPEIVKGVAQAKVDALEQKQSELPKSENNLSETKLYHGTSKEVADEIEKNGFDFTKSADGTIWFSNDKSRIEKGDSGAGQNGSIIERKIDESKLKLGGWDERDKYAINQLIAMGYDGMKYEDDGHIDYQIFHPEKLEKILKEPPTVEQTVADKGGVKTSDVSPVEEKSVGLVKAEKEYNDKLDELNQKVKDAEKEKQDKINSLNKKVDLFEGKGKEKQQLFDEGQDQSEENIKKIISTFDDAITKAKSERDAHIENKEEFLKKYDNQSEISNDNTEPKNTTGKGDDNKDSTSPENKKTEGVGNNSNNKKSTANDQRTKDALKKEFTDPYHKALQWFVRGNKLHPSAIEELYGGAGKKVTKEFNKRIGLLHKGKGYTIKEIAHNIWENRDEWDNRYTDQDYRNAVEEVINNHISKRTMIDELLDNKSDEEKYYEEYGQHDIEDEFLSEAENHWDSLSDKEKEEMYKGAIHPEDIIDEEEHRVKYDSKKSSPVLAPSITDTNFDELKDSWIGNTDVLTHNAKVEAAKFQEELQKSLPRKKGENRFDYAKRWQQLDQAIHVYLDTKRNPEHLKEFEDKLTPEQKKIVDLSQNLTDTQKEIAQRISDEYEKMGNISKDAGVIKTALDNYVARTWDFKGKGSEAQRKFGTSTRHSIERTLDTILEGWSKGYELKYKGATNNLRILKTEIGNVIENQNIINEGSKTDYTDENGNTSKLFTTSPEDGYTKIVHPNFKKWSYVGKVEGQEEGKIMGAKKDTFVTPNGAILQKTDVYAPDKIAKRINNIIGTSKLKNMGGKIGNTVDWIRDVNSRIKQIVLTTSLFHHLAFTRNKYLSGDNFFENTSLKSSKDAGLKSIKENSPILEHLIHNGLTLGNIQDWDELVNNEKSKVSKKLDDLGFAPKVRERISDLAKEQKKYLFDNFGAGLKADAAIKMYNNYLLKHPEIDPIKVAKIVAEFQNNNFGGLNLKRIERNPTTQDFMHLALLAPDWTESNLRMAAHAFKFGEDSKEERQFTQKMWGRVFLRGAQAVALSNLALALIPDPNDKSKDPLKNMVERYKRAWKEGGLNWTNINISPIAHYFGADKDRDYYFPVFGHYTDPIKFVSDPLTTLKNKMAIVPKAIDNARTGENWQGRKYTNVDELFGLDDKGKYSKSQSPHKKGELSPTDNPYTKDAKGYTAGTEKGGKLKGKLTKFSEGGAKPLDITEINSRIPSYTLDQLQSMTPIQIQNLLEYASGERDGFTTLTNSIGLGVKSKKIKDK